MTFHASRISETLAFLLLTLFPALGLAEAPVCDSTTATVAENSAFSYINMICSDEDVDIDADSYVVVNEPSIGAIVDMVDVPPLKAVYVPDRGKSGPDSFTFTVSDDALNTAVPATANINVAPLPRGGAYALEGDAGCLIIDSGPVMCDRQTAGLTGIGRAVMAPDGKNIYSISIGLDYLAVVNVGTDGVLSQFPDTRNCFSRTGSADEDGFGFPMHSCQNQPRLDGIQDIAVSPDNKHVYVVAANTSSILQFTRDTAANPPGALTYAGCISASGGGGCSQGHALALDGVSNLSISADGKFIYALSITPSVISVLARNETTGVLSQANNASGCFSDGAAGCTALAGLDAVRKIALSPDNRNLYTFSTQKVNAFARNEATGAISLPSSGVNCLNGDGSGGCSLGRNFAAALEHDLLITPNGAHLYLPSDMGIAVFSRDENGLLSQPAGQAGCVNTTGASGCAAFDYGHLLNRGAVSPDGRTLYAIHRRFDLDQRMILAWSIDQSTGALTPLIAPFYCISGVGECVLTPFGIFNEHTDLALSPNGSRLYAAISGTQKGFMSFAVNRVPACQNSSASATGELSVPLDCTDADNEDVTIRIVATPAHGTLGAINQTAKTVVYQPQAGYNGTDSFTYAASDGTEGAAATVEISVMQTVPTPTPAPTATPTVVPTLTPAPGGGYAVRGFVFFDDQPLEGALVVCESIGAVFTASDGSFDCGYSQAPVAIMVSKPGYIFEPAVIDEDSTPLVLEAINRDPAPSGCARRELLNEKKALHNALLVLTAATGNALRTAANLNWIRKDLAAKAAGAAYADYRRAFRKVSRLPDASDICPASVRCQRQDSGSALRSIALLSSKIRRHGMLSIHPVKQQSEDLKVRAFMAQRSVLRADNRLKRVLGRWPRSNVRCG